MRTWGQASIARDQVVDRLSPADRGAEVLRQIPRSPTSHRSRFRVVWILEAWVCVCLLNFVPGAPPPPSAHYLNDQTSRKVTSCTKKNRRARGGMASIRPHDEVPMQWGPAGRRVASCGHWSGSWNHYPPPSESSGRGNRSISVHTTPGASAALLVNSLPCYPASSLPGQG